MEKFFRPNNSRGYAMRCRIVLCMFLFCSVANAREAKTFKVTPTSALQIDPKTDHFSIIFEAGWVSQKDSVFKTLFSKATKLTAEADSQCTFFDVANPVKTARVFNNTDVGHQLNRPWGGSGLVVVSSYPADTSITLNAKATVYNDDRISDLLQTFQKNDPTSGIDATAELGYANLADALFIDLFNTNQTQLPFTMEVDVAPGSGSFQEYYVIGVAPNNDSSDSLLTNMASNSSKIAYDESTSTLSYNNQSIQDHSWAVFKVQKADDPNIQQLTFSSTAPWAVLAINDFYLPTPPDVTSASDAAKQDKAALGQLQSEVSLLKNELRFSAYDRAVALEAFAQHERGIIQAACTAGNVTTADCKTSGIDQFSTTIASDFGLDTSKQPTIKATAQKLNSALVMQFNLK